MTYQITVNIAEGKYTYVMNAGGSHVYRHMEPWRDCTGDKLLLCMAQDIESAREKCDELTEELVSADTRLSLIEEDILCGNMDEALQKCKMGAKQRREVIRKARGLS